MIISAIIFGHLINNFSPITMNAIGLISVISNIFAIAASLASRGADVTLVSGKTNLEPPMFVKVINVVSARDMYEAVIDNFDEQDIVIKAAAVADYRPKNPSDEKVKKSDTEMSIDLERTDDILKTLGERKSKQFLCGFSMETENMIENSKKKLEKKHLDMIVANNLKKAGAGFGTDTNIVTIITPDGTKELDIMSKDKVAENIVNEILEKI